MLESPAEILARVQRGTDSFLELKEVIFAGGKLKRPDRKAFRRRANSKRQMRPEEVAYRFALQRRAGFIGFDEQTVDAASFQDLSPDLIDRFKTERTDDDAETFAHKLGMVARTERGELRPTIAGILFCTSNPERWLPGGCPTRWSWTCSPTGRLPGMM